MSENSNGQIDFDTFSGADIITSVKGVVTEYSPSLNNHWWSDIEIDLSSNFKEKFPSNGIAFALVNSNNLNWIAESDYEGIKLYLEFE